VRQLCIILLDVSFVRAARLRQSPRYFGELVPDLVVEIKSQSEIVKPLEKKIKNFIELGAQVGILIDPDEETVTVYRQEGEPIVLGNEDILTVTKLFPGWNCQFLNCGLQFLRSAETQA
jgi:Uma2 family endonuclease